MDIADRAAGAMAGMAVGEALGAPFEGLTHEEVIARAGRVDGFIDPRRLQSPQRQGYFTPFTYEDDTQISLACADVLVRGGTFTPTAFRDRLMELGAPIDGNAFGCFRRARRNFRLSVRKMFEGKSWEETGVNTAGSGACARGIPIGVWFRNDPAGLIRAAIESALVTHKDPRAVAGTVAVAFTIATCVKDGAEKFAASTFVPNLAAFVRSAEDVMASQYAHVLRPNFEGVLHQVSDALARIPEVLELDVEPAFAKIVAISEGKGSRPITSATRGFVLTTLLTSLYFFLTGLSSYEDTVLDICAEGGATDSLACLVGGCLGALHGFSKIPEPWRRAVRNLDQVELRGRMLAGAPNDGLKSMVLLEAALTPPTPKPVPRPKKPKGKGIRGGFRGRPMRGPGGMRGPRPGFRPPGRPFGGLARGGFRGPPRPGFGRPRPGFGGPGPGGRGPRPGFGGPGPGHRGPPPDGGWRGPPRGGFSGPRPGGFGGGPPRGGFRGPPRPGGPWRPPFDDRRPPPRFPDGPPSDSSPMRQDDRDD
ncbi:MAG: hypothetical protein RIS21_1220 [Planctomycetota bacterium]